MVKCFHVLLALAVGSFAASCSSATLHGEFALHDAPPVGTYAVVAPGTAWATSPLPGASRADPGQGHTTSYFGRVLGFRGKMAALEVGEASDPHCAWTLPNLHALRLVLWVPKDSLLPVLTRAQRRRYPDGTGYDLAPGLPVGQPVADAPEPGHRYRPLSTERFVTAAALDERAVGLTYQPTALPEAETSSQEQWVDGPSLALGDGLLLRQPNHKHELWSGQVRPDPQDSSMVLVGLEDRCARFIVRVPAAAMGGALGSLMIGSLGTGKPQVKTGARLLWPDGSSAGYTTQDTAVGRLLYERSGLRCFGVEVFRRVPSAALASDGVAAGELVVCAGIGDGAGAR